MRSLGAPESLATAPLITGARNGFGKARSTKKNLIIRVFLGRGAARRRRPGVSTHFSNIKARVAWSSFAARTWAARAFFNMFRPIVRFHSFCQIRVLDEAFPNRTLPSGSVRNSNPVNDFYFLFSDLFAYLYEKIYVTNGLNYFENYFLWKWVRCTFICLPTRIWNAIEDECSPSSPFSKDAGKIDKIRFFDN